MHTTEKVAKMVKLSPRGVLKAAKAADLVPIRFGKSIAWSDADVQAIKGRNRKVGKPRRREK